MTTIMFDKRQPRGPLCELRVEVPATDDAPAMWALAARSGLDPSSPQCYQSMCRDLAPTSVVARDGDELVGFAAGFEHPKRSDTLIVWQVSAFK